MTESFMGMPKWQTFQELGGNLYGTNISQHPQHPQQPVYTYSSSFTSTSQPPVKDLPLRIWMNALIQILYIMSRTFKAYENENNLPALRVFFDSLLHLIPNADYRKYVEDFMQMKPYVKQLLLTSSPALFRSVPGLKQKFESNQEQDFIDRAFKNTDGQALFLWVYALHSFLVAVHNSNVDRQSNLTPFTSTSTAQQYLTVPSLNQLREMYAINNLEKKDWGNPTWFFIHILALYAPEPIAQSFEYYKQFIHSLKYLLPCGLCRKHLTDNLVHIDFDNCFKTREELFKCGWKLHNIVNQSLNKPQLSLQQAWSLYTF